jgi:hypothetical protein
MIRKIVLVCIFVRIVQCLIIKNKCNTLYFDEMDKIMIRTQNPRTKVVMDNFFKRRATQSGLNVYYVKNCYNTRAKKKNVIGK